MSPARVVVCSCVPSVSGGFVAVFDTDAGFGSRIGRAWEVVEGVPSHQGRNSVHCTTGVMRQVTLLSDWCCSSALMYCADSASGDEPRTSRMTAQSLRPLGYRREHGWGLHSIRGIYSLWKQIEFCEEQTVVLCRANEVLILSIGASVFFPSTPWRQRRAPAKGCHMRENHTKRRCRAENVQTEPY